MPVDIQADQPGRRQPEQQRYTQHAQSAQGQAQASAQACQMQLAGPLVQADPEGAGIGNAGGQHEGHIDRLYGNLVCGQLQVAEGAHAQRGDHEQ